jgi:hypothetical protein
MSNAFIEVLVGGFSENFYLAPGPCSLVGPRCYHLMLFMKPRPLSGRNTLVGRIMTQVPTRGSFLDSAPVTRATSFLPRGILRTPVGLLERRDLLLLTLYLSYSLLGEGWSFSEETQSSGLQDRC